MEEAASTSTSASASSSSSSDSDEGGDGDGTEPGADSAPRAPPTHGGIPDDETAFADSSIAFNPGKPAVPSRGKSDVDVTGFDATSWTALCSTRSLDGKRARLLGYSSAGHVHLQQVLSMCSGR